MGSFGLLRTCQIRSDLEDERMEIRHRTYRLLGFFFEDDIESSPPPLDHLRSSFGARVSMSGCLFCFSFCKKTSYLAVTKNKWPKSDEKTGFGSTLGLPWGILVSTGKLSTHNRFHKTPPLAMMVRGCVAQAPIFGSGLCGATTPETG